MRRLAIERGAPTRGLICSVCLSGDAQAGRGLQVIAPLQSKERPDGNSPQRASRLPCAQPTPKPASTLRSSWGVAGTPQRSSVEYHAAMTVAQGTVQDGKVVLQGVALPEGAIVTVLADDDRPPVKLSPELEAELNAAIDEAAAEVGGAGPEFLENLKRYG